MEAQAAELLQEASNDLLEVRSDYSGRGMYGDRTTALVGDNEDFKPRCR